MIGERVKKALEDKKVKPLDMAAYIGISEAHFKRLYSKDSFEIKYLRKIAEKLDLPLSYFLPELETTSSITQSGVGNVGSGGKIKNQKIIQSGTESANSEVSEANILELQYKLNLCETEKASLAEKLQLKDEIIELLKGKQ